MLVETCDKAYPGPHERFVRDKGHVLGGKKAQFIGRDVSNLKFDRQAENVRSLFGQIHIDGCIRLPGDIAMPRPGVMPQKSKRRTMCSRFRQLALKQFVLRGIGIEGDAG